MTTEIRVPDIGDFTDVPVIEVLVKPGDSVNVEDPLVTLESDKATMDVPSPAAGVVTQLRVSVGDRVSEGSVLAVLEPETEFTPAPESVGATSTAPAADTSAPAPTSAPGPARARSAMRRSW